MIKFIDLEERNRMADVFRQNQGPLLPATIDEAVDGRISYADLEKGLSIRFPFVEGMRVGGRYHVLLSAEDAGFGLGGVIQEENQDTVVAVPADRALAFQGQEAGLVYYYLEFDESTSPSTQYSIEGQIYKPIVDEAVNGVIPLSVLSQGVNLRIRAASSLTSGALVSVYWWGSYTDACFVRHLVIGPDPVDDLVLPVESGYLMPVKHGTVRVIYTVQSTSGSRASPVLELGVAGDLAVPEAVYQIGDDHRVAADLLPINESGNIPMLLKTQGMVVGDVAILIFVGGRQGTEFVLRHLVKASDIEAGQIRYDVPAPFLSLGSAIRVWSLVDRLAGAIGSPDLHLYLDLGD